MITKGWEADCLHLFDNLPERTASASITITRRGRE